MKLYTSNGFTLAEVLITLGIIGIVAALTIPTLMHNYQKRVLKTQFKKAYAMMQQNFSFAVNDFGDDVKSYCTTWVLKDTGKGDYINSNECIEMFDNYFKIVGTCNYKNPPQNYAKNNKGYMDIGARITPENLLADGSCYGTVVNAATLGFTFDINGADKGPNAIGHDIFVFHVNNDDSLEPVKMTGSVSKDELDEYMTENCPEGSILSCGSGMNQKGYPCTKNSTQKGNGLGCSWYALNDICPDDETKGYWDCLP